MTSEENIFIEEQFVSGEQQDHAVTLGMWVFLATEVLFFGGLLIVYSVYRSWYPHEFAEGSRHLDFALGTLNTAILLFSSFLMAGAVTARRLSDRRTTVNLLILIAICGMTFLTIKAYEWHIAIQEGRWPGNASSPHPHGMVLFYSLYFALTGLHGLHLLIGIVAVLVMAARCRNGSPLIFLQNPLKLTGLYWHFIDIVWIFLYPLLYFIGRSS